MTSSTRLLTRAFLSSLPLIAACSTGKPPSEDDTVATGATGGSSSGTSGNGGSAASSTGGSAASSSNGGSVGVMGGASGSAAMGGAAATAATGGDVAMGGSSGSAAAGGDAGSAAVGGTAGASAAAGMGGMSGTDPGICQHLSAVATPQVPTMELVVDTSSSMFKTNPTAWSVLYTALDGMDGVVPALQDKMYFGFTSYKGLLGSSETDPACATMTTVDPAPMNFAAIDAVYKKLGEDDKGAAWTINNPPPKWETPTNYAIGYAVQELQAFNPMPPGPKYILLVTDGNPNTCEVVDPQCGQDYAIKATQDAYAAGVGLFVVGVGDIVTDPDNGCSGTGQHCGLAHLQDLANAGVGAPVLAPCDDVTSDQCQAKTSSNCIKDRTLTASYTVDAPAVGVPFQVDTSSGTAQAELKKVLTDLLNTIVSCSFELDVIVTGDPSLGLVSLGGTPVTYDVPDGWILEADSFHVTLTGAACESYKAGAEVSIDFPCDPSGNPIAVHR
ncbi:MAG TPA: hypothetical protein VFV94_17650 [Polyangiaceae bacterium]|nr:hypothetical protein [Polyangiaceae bacterium]